MAEVESKETSTHYLAKVGKMYVSKVYMHSGVISLDWAELNALQLTRDEAEFCKKFAGAEIKGVKVEVTYFDNDFE